MKEFALGVVSIVVAITFLAVGGEIAMRAWNYSHGHFSNTRSFSVIRLDDELGWVPVSNYLSSEELVDASGISYSATVQTDDSGFRMYGNPHEETKKKVLFIGDSFTHAIHVSNDKIYYALLKKNLDIEVFPLAVEGYGTLQEYMMLDKYVDRIDPDLVVIQFCGNDFINNHYELELVSTWNNNRLRRPYFINQSITYKTPSNFPAIRDFAANYSHFMYLIISRIDRLNASHDKSEESVEHVIATQGLAFPLFKESVEITERLLRMIKQRIGAQTPILAFSTGHAGREDKEFKRLSEEIGIRYIESPSLALRAAEHAGVTITVADGQHWNNAGHQIVANALQPYLEQRW